MGILSNLIGNNAVTGIFKSSLKAQYSPTTLTSNVFHQIRNSRGLGQIGAAVGIYKGTQAIGNEIDVANERSGRGSGWGGLVRGAGAVGAGAIGVSGASKMAAQQMRVLGNTFSSEKYQAAHKIGSQAISRLNDRRHLGRNQKLYSDLRQETQSLRGRYKATFSREAHEKMFYPPSQPSPSMPGILNDRSSAKSDMASVARKRKITGKQIRNVFNQPVDRSALTGSTSLGSGRLDSWANHVEGFPKMALGFGGRMAGDAALGVAAAPFAPYMVMKHGLANSNYAGSAMAGFGLWGGAAAAGIGGMMADRNEPRNREALGGTSYVDASSGQRPRSTGLDPALANTAGLVQSLHKLR